MRRLRYTFATLAAAAFVPILVLMTPASASQDITVYDHQSHFRFDTATQTFSFNGTLHLDGRHGTVVGSVKVRCTELAGHQMACTATATFTAQGQIFVSGNANSNKDHFFLPITGGNGDFAGATGQVERTGLAGNLELLVFHLK